MQEDDDEKWVFGYGSLMWRPGFPFLQARQARVYGYHRSLCVYSHVHRGTPDNPGLVLGLDRGGACRGMGYRVADEVWDQTVAYLRLREQATSVYLETNLELIFDDGQRRRGLAYVIDREHLQYAGGLDTNTMLKLVRQSVGQSGPNPEYVLNTHKQLEEMGIKDRHLSQLAKALQENNGHR